MGLNGRGGVVIAEVLLKEKNDPRLSADGHVVGLFCSDMLAPHTWLSHCTISTCGDSVLGHRVAKE